MLLGKLVPNLIRTNDLGPSPNSPFFASWVHLRPQTQVHIFMMAVKWAAVVNLLMTSPFPCHQWVWVRATGTDRWRQDGGNRALFWGCKFWRTGLEMKLGLWARGWFETGPCFLSVQCEVTYNDMYVTWHIPKSWDPLQVRVPVGNFTNGKQMGHTSQLLSLSICEAACCFLFFFF